MDGLHHEILTGWQTELVHSDEQADGPADEDFAAVRECKLRGRNDDLCFPCARGTRDLQEAALPGCFCAITRTEAPLDEVQDFPAAPETTVASGSRAASERTSIQGPLLRREP